jgi:hypothetical protein
VSGRIVMGRIVVGRIARGRVATSLAIALLVAVPLIPGVVAAGSATGLLRIPVESIVVVLLLALLPWRIPRIVVSAAYGVVVVVALVLAGIDAGYESVLDIHFDPLDYQQLGDAFGVVQDGIGAPAAVALMIVLGAVAVALVVVLAWAALRVDAAIRRDLRRGTAVTTTITAAWVIAALAGSQLVAGQPAAASASVGAIASAASRATTTLSAQASLPQQVANDPYRRVPSSELLTSLRGKDVIIAFVESYGQVAVQNTSFSGAVDQELRQGESQLTAEGYGSRSAWLTSPTFGGLSWLAHSTLQTGLWIDKQPIYSKVIRTKRFTLSDAFRKAGWNTVSDVPSDTHPWSYASSFYHYGTDLDTNDVGYHGPAFGYARVPDQYTWKYFEDHQLTGPHKPVMAEIDLVSSHTPWAPLPQLVPWSQIGDGSIYVPQPAQGNSTNEVWSDPAKVQQAYGQSIQYSLGSLFSFLQNTSDPNLVLVVLGDHQPATIVSGTGANHRVPISIISKDPAVLTSIAGWHWQPGLLPDADAPLWRMDAFRNRFLDAYGTSG